MKKQTLFLDQQGDSKEQFILLFGIYLFIRPDTNLVDGALTKAISFEINLLCMEKETIHN